MTDRTDVDLLRQLTDRAAAFALAALAALANRGGTGTALAAEDDTDIINGVVVVVIDTDPVKSTLTVDGACLGTSNGDEGLAAMAAAVVERGLTQVRPAARRRAVELLAAGQAVLTLMVPQGQDIASVHGLWTKLADDGTVASQSELFVLYAADAGAQVH
jgi:hypothetical protein